MFVFKDSATTEIYTYLHTHSLHDSLPITNHKQHPAQLITNNHNIPSPKRQGPLQASYRVFLVGNHLLNVPHVDAPEGFSDSQLAHRSEEHTSELQSLMRISYAAFCLNKTTYIDKQYHKTITYNSI